MYSYTNKKQEVELLTSLTSYGEIMIANITPIIQSDFNYGINAEMFSTGTLSGTNISQNSNIAVECSGTAGSFSEIKSKRLLRYRPGQGNGLRFSALFTTASNGTTQIIGCGDQNDGYFIGYSGSNFGILRRTRGVEHWTLQSEFNIDKIDGTSGTSFQINPEKGNVFDVQYQWLGYGAITFNVENPATGKFIPFHRIKYSNTNSETSTKFGSNPFLIRVDCHSTSAVKPVLKTASMMAYLEGSLVYTGPTFAVTGSKTNVIAQQNILTIKNVDTYRSLPNKIPVKTKTITIAVEGTKPVVLSAIKNATLGGTPTYTSASSESVIVYDTAGTTATGGSYIGSFTLAKTDSIIITDKEIETFINPGEALTFTAESKNATEVTVTVNWVEDH